MSNTYLIFVVLHTFQFIVFYQWGKKMSLSKTDKQYWKAALVPIITFFVVSGLRFGRGIDYNCYYFKFSYGFGHDAELGIEYLFALMHQFHIPYMVFPILCSIMLIFSFCLFLKHYKQCAMYALPLLLGVSGIENLLRWYLAISLLLIAVYFYNETKYRNAIICSVLSLLFHKGVIIIMPIITLSYIFLNNKVFNIKIVITLYFLTTFFASTGILTKFAIYVNVFFTLIGFSSTGSEYMDSYLDNIVDISSGAMSTGVYETALSTSIRKFIAYSFILTIGNRYFSSNNTELKWFYNLLCITLIVAPLFNLVEIFNRIAAALTLFTIVPVALALYNKKRTIYYNRGGVCLFYILLFFTYYPIVKTPFDVTNETTQMLYLWDAHGKEYVPFEEFGILNSHYYNM